MLAATTQRVVLGIIAGLVGLAAACGRGSPDRARTSESRAGSRCFGMPCCQPGHGVSGIEGGQLVCRLAPGATPQDCFVDHPTMREGARACPQGTYLRGWDRHRNLLTCCFDLARGATPMTAPRAVAASPAGEARCGPGAELATAIIPGNGGLVCSRAVPAPRPAPQRFVPLEFSPERPRGVNALGRLLTPAAWRTLVRNWLARLHDLPVRREELQARAVELIEARVVEGGVTRKKVRYLSLGGRQRIPAYLFLPAGYRRDGEYRAVLLLHGHFPHAKEGLAEGWDTPPHALALLLAQRGFVTLAPDTRGWGEFLVARGKSHEELTELYRTSTTGRPGQLPAATLYDNLVNVSVLSAVPGVRSVSVGGLSLGGTQAMWLAAMDERIASVFLAGSFVSFACLNDPALAHACQTVPGLSANPDDPAGPLLLDAPDLAALIAPRPLLVAWGSEDPMLALAPAGTDVPCSSTALAGAQAVYDELGLASALYTRMTRWMEHEIDTAEVVTFLTGHRPREALDWGTRCDDIHCCPAGEAIAGVHPSRDLFLCRKVDDDDDGCVVDTTTRRQGLRACPTGTYMRGVDARGDRLLCCREAGAPAERVEPAPGKTPVYAQGLPACPPDLPIARGIAAGRMALLCGAAARSSPSR